MLWLPGGGEGAAGAEEARGGEGRLKLIDLGLCRSIGGCNGAGDDDGGGGGADGDADDQSSPALARQLTAHVVTRSYRAPELLFPPPPLRAAATGVAVGVKVI